MLIDSFLFFNEAELAELRIKYLEKTVDCFVVVEDTVLVTPSELRYVTCIISPIFGNSFRNLRSQTALRRSSFSYKERAL